MELITKILNLIYPTKCIECGEINNKNICNKCIARLGLKEHLHIKENNNKNFTKHLYLFKYKGRIREKIIQYKFDNKAFIYRFFAERILELDKKEKFLNGYDYLIPVPISKERTFQRGYNQSELIAKEVCKHIRKIKLVKLVNKKKDNVAQSTLKAKDRIENVKDVYELNNREFMKVKKELNKKYLILDDIYTTGNTVNEVAKVIKEAGIENIDVFTIAKD